jgi:hypothetical protein
MKQQELPGYLLMPVYLGEINTHHCLQGHTKNQTPDRNVREDIHVSTPNMASIRQMCI